MFTGQVYDLLIKPQSQRYNTQQQVETREEAKMAQTFSYGMS